MGYALNEQLGLKQPYPQALSKMYPSRFGFAIWNGDNFCFFNFHMEYAAKWLIDCILEDRDYKWVDTRTIITSNGIKIRGERSHDLETIVEYKLSAKEAQWVPPEPYLTYYRQIAGRADIKKPITPTPRPAPVPPAERPDGLIPLSDIAAEMNIDPREARQILRKKTDKPAWGWAWPSNAVASIKKILNGK